MTIFTRNSQGINVDVVAAMISYEYVQYRAAWVPAGSPRRQLWRMD